jgi:hypothetical protein
VTDPLSHGGNLRSVWWIPVVGFLVAVVVAWYNHGGDIFSTGLILNTFGNTTAFALVTLLVCVFAESQSSKQAHKKRWATKAKGAAIFVILGATLTLLGFITAVGFGLA